MNSGLCMEVLKWKCVSCGHYFYEFDSDELENCPHCNVDFFTYDPNFINARSAELVVDAKTGDLSIL